MRHRIVSKTDARGNTTRYEYDALGRAVKETFADNSSWQLSYGNPIDIGTSIPLYGLGFETHVIDPRGNPMRYRFNPNGYWVKMTDALGREQSRSIDFYTNLTRATIDAAGRVTRYTYDGRGNLTSVQDPLGQLTVTQYHPVFDKPVSFRNALGFVTALEYDTKGNLITLTNAENEITRFDNTDAGQLASITDALNNVTRFGYDAEGNLLAVTDALGNRTASVYDTANRLIESVDAIGATSRLDYDVADRVTQVTDALGGLTRLGYDNNDNLVSVIDANDHSIETNVFDPRNRLVIRTDALGVAENFEYDGMGNLTRVTDRRGRVTDYTYDAINRLTRVVDADGRTTTSTYNLAGNLVNISDSVSGDIVLHYDELDRLTHEISNQGVVRYGYDAIGRRISRTVNEEDTTTYTYDKADRLILITWSRPGQADQLTGYAYDAAGRLIRKSLPNGIITNYSYDAASRLTQIQYARSDASIIETIGYLYDARDNRIQKTIGIGSADETPFTATYDAANRMSSISINAETCQLGYDANGNLANKACPTSGTTVYSWDAKDRLTGISATNLTASFEYDALGRRIARTVNGETTRYLYDGIQAIAETTNAGTSKLLTGLQVDEMIARYTDGTARVFLTDALGSVIAQSRDDQTIQNFYGYSPYGEATPTADDEGNSSEYTARENDGTGLYYYRARYYDAVLKRFVSEDPIGLAGGINVHGYVGGNPILYSDPYGLDFYTSPPPEDPGVGAAHASFCYDNPYHYDCMGPNGNLWGGFDEQDDECSTGWFSNSMNSNPDILQCCVAHDACFRQYGCNYSSFFGPIIGVSLACQQCNSDVQACIRGPQVCSDDPLPGP